MSQLIRESDQTSFIIQAFREDIAIKKEIKNYVKDYGEFVFVTKNEESFDVVFSEEEGYLLSETIWDYFEKANNFLFVEILNETEVLCILILDGQVQLEEKVEFDEFEDLFNSVKVDKESLKAYIVKHPLLATTILPLLEEMKSESGENFVIIEDSVFNTIDVSEHYKLHDYKSETSFDIKAMYARYKQYVLIVAGVFVVACVIGFSFLFMTPEQVKVIQTNEISKALKSHKASKQMLEIYNIINLTYQIPGWVPQKITFSGSLLKVVMLSVGSKRSLLQTFALENKLKFRVAKKKVKVEKAKKKNDLPFVKTAKPVQEYILEKRIVLKNNKKNIVKNIEKFKDEFEENFSKHALNMSMTDKILKKSDHKVLEIKLKFNNLPFFSFLQLSDEFETSPVYIKLLNADLNNGGLSGHMTLKVIAK